MAVVESTLNKAQTLDLYAAMSGVRMVSQPHKKATIIGAIAASGKQSTAKYLALRCVSGMLENAQACFRYAQVCFRYAEVCFTYSLHSKNLRYASGMIQVCFGYASGALWVCFRYALSIL